MLSVLIALTSCRVAGLSFGVVGVLWSECACRYYLCVFVNTYSCYCVYVMCCARSGLALCLGLLDCSCLACAVFVGVVVVRVRVCCGLCLFCLML